MARPGITTEDRGSEPGKAGPERMRQAVADYVTAVHDAYLRQARTLPPAGQATMPLLAGGQMHVAAAGTSQLHVIATREPLGGGQRGEMASVDGTAGPMRWRLAFYDPVVVPALGWVDERDGPAFEEVRRLLGIGTHLYHLTIQPGSGLTAHHAEHAGTGLANAHATAVREAQAIERAVEAADPNRAALAAEFAGALAAGLPRAAALLALALAPADERVEALAADARAGAPADAADLRRAVLHAVQRRTAGPDPER